MLFIDGNTMPVAPNIKGTNYMYGHEQWINVVIWDS